MNRFVRRCGLFAALLAGAGACSPMQTEGEQMFLRNAGADLPVLVRGHTDSKVMIVWLTGGPGDPTAISRGPATNQLEERYGVTYWDQRGCGSAQGNPAPETFTMDQFIDDTHKVIALVRHRYGSERVFLLGHSWGGTLGTAYLLDRGRQAKIAGWIDVDGNHDVPRVFPMKLAWLEHHAEAQVAAGIDVGRWTDVRNWTSSHPPLTRANLHRIEHDRAGTNATFFDPKQGFEVGFDLIFRSPESVPAYFLVNADYVEESLYRSDDVLTAMSYSARMKEITLPSLLLWGKHDGVVPPPAAEAALAALGTDASEKRIVYFERSAHFPFLEEPDAFAAAVTAFVEAHR